MQGSISWKICKTILEKLKRNGKNEDNFFKNAFTMPTQDQKRAVTRAELRKVINQSLILPVSEEEFKSLMFILDPGHTNFIDCENFLNLFKLINEDKGNQTLLNSKLPEEVDIESKSQNPNLRGEKLKVTFKKCFNKSFKNIEKALYAFDSEETGAINVDDFKKILDVFCFPLTEKQFSEILSDFTTTNKIFYGDFIHFYQKSPYEDEEKWKSCIKRLVSPRIIPKQKLNHEEVLKYVQDIISSNKDVFLHEFQESDLCNTGSVRKDIFSKVLQKYAFRLTDEQFQLLWEKLPKNEIGFLKYNEYLDEWCKAPISTPLRCEGKTPSMSRSNSIISLSSKNSSRASATSKERPKTASSILSVKSSASKQVDNRPKSASTISQHSKSYSHLSVSGKGLENCGILTKEQYKQYKSLDFGKTDCLSRPASQTRNSTVGGDKPNENKVQGRGNHQTEYEKIIKRRWRDILRRCKAADKENHDILLWDDFLSVLQRTGVDTSEDTVKSLEAKYKIKRDFPVNYWTFLKKFLIKLNFDQSLKAANIKEWSPKLGNVAGHESVGLCKVLLNYRDKILKNYRDLHHAFQRADPQHTGEIKTLEFRKILTFHKIYMTDDDLFYIQDYYDPKLSEKIPYDKFLKSFIRN